MKKAAALLLLLLPAGCAEPDRRPFPVALAAPVSPRVSAEAGRLGLTVAAETPPGAAVVDAGEAGTAASLARLRFLSASAVADGAAGVVFRLPGAPEGRDALDFPEEWQAVSRAARELQAMRGVLEEGVADLEPPPSAAGAKARGWLHRGRRYALLVNATGAPAALDPQSLAEWRALFTVRADPREALIPCPGGRCLPAGAALWLEGRPL